MDGINRPGAVIQNCDSDPVAYRGDIAFGSALFEFAAQLADNDIRFGFNPKETGLRFDDETLSVCQKSISSDSILEGDCHFYFYGITPLEGGVGVYGGYPI